VIGARSNSASDMPCRLGAIIDAAKGAWPHFFPAPATELTEPGPGQRPSPGSPNDDLQGNATVDGSGKWIAGPQLKGKKRTRRHR